jgi:transcription initiation factor TFIIB
MNAVSDLYKSVNLCPECGGNIISVQETGDIVCNQCGLVMHEKSVDFSHNDRRAYSKEEKYKRERTGAPISNLVPDIGLTTTIDRKKITNPDLKRASKWDTRIPWQKRNILIATTELKRISTNLNLPNHVKEEAMHLYKEAFKRKLLRGRSINSMIAACIYYAIRKNRVSRTLHEILEETAEKNKDVRRCYKELNLKAPNTKPSDLIPKFIAELDLSSEVENLATKMVKTFISHFSSSGKDPKGIVGGVIYLACKIKNISYTQKQIADKIGVTEVTLRSRYKELKQKLNISL